MLPLNDLINENIGRRNLFLDALAANVREVYISPDTKVYDVIDEKVKQILENESDNDDDDLN